MEFKFKWNILKVNPSIANLPQTDSHRLWLNVINSCSNIQHPQPYTPNLIHSNTFTHSPPISFVPSSINHHRKPTRTLHYARFRLTRIAVPRKTQLVIKASPDSSNSSILSWNTNAPRGKTSWKSANEASSSCVRGRQWFRGTGRSLIRNSTRVRDGSRISEAARAEN